MFTYATNPPQVYRSNNSRPSKNSTPSLLSSKRNSIIHDSIRYSFLDFTRPLQTTYLKPHYAFMRISSALTYSQMCTKMCTEYQNNAPESHSIVTINHNNAVRLTLNPIMSFYLCQILLSKFH